MSEVVATISPQEAYEQIQAKRGLLIDVRELQEYEEIHISGATLLPLSQLELSQIEALPLAGKTLIVHCRSGARSHSVCALLQQAKFAAPLYNLEGGILAWETAGLPIKKR